MAEKELKIKIKGIKGDDGYSPVKGKDYFDGKDGETPTKESLEKIIKPLIPKPIKGEDYVLTSKDKKEIASSIKVPILEKVIEKTEVIKEVVVKDTPKEVKAKLLKEGLDYSEVQNTPDIPALVQKINIEIPNIVRSVTKDISAKTYSASEIEGLTEYIEETAPTPDLSTLLKLSDNQVIRLSKDGSVEQYKNANTDDGRGVSLTSALNNVVNGDVLYLCDGQFNLAPLFGIRSKTYTVIGANREQTIINVANYTGLDFSQYFLYSSKATFKDLTIKAILMGDSDPDNSTISSLLYLYNVHTIGTIDGFLNFIDYGNHQGGKAYIYDSLLESGQDILYLGNYYVYNTEIYMNGDNGSGSTRNVAIRMGQGTKVYMYGGSITASYSANILKKAVYGENSLFLDGEVFLYDVNIDLGTYDASSYDIYLESLYNGTLNLSNVTTRGNKIYTASPAIINYLDNSTIIRSLLNNSTTTADFGSKYLKATKLITSGGASTDFVKGDGSLDGTTYATASALAGYVPYTGATANLNLGNYNLATKNLDVTGTTITVGDVTGTPSGTWTYDDSGYYFDYGITDYAIRVYAYKNLEDGSKVFSTNYAQGSDTSDPGNVDDATFYFTWSWNAVAGADGYRVVFFNPDMGWNYTYYQDVTTNSFIDAIGDDNWQSNPTPLATPTSAYVYSHIRESLAITGKLTIGETINSVGEITAPTVNVTDGTNSYKVNGQTVMRFVDNGSGGNAFFGPATGSTSTSIYHYANCGFAPGGIFDSLTTGHENVGGGSNVGGALTTQSGNTLMGHLCLSSVNAGEYNSFYGNKIAYGATGIGDSNDVSGASAIYLATGGSANTIHGSLAGYRLAGDYNIFNGYGAGSRETGSYKIIFDTTARTSQALEQANAIIWGQMATTAPTQTLRFNARVGINIDPTAYLTLPAGSTTAGTAPIKMTSGTLTTTAVAGQIEFLTDKYYGTISTGSARKEFTLNDIALTSGRVSFSTTNGRQTDSTNFTWNGTVLGVTGSVSASTNVLTPVIKTDTSTPTDLTITTGAGKTLVLGTPVYEDIQFSIASGRIPAVNAPTWETFTTNTEAYAFSVDDKIQLGAEEPPHGWVEGSAGTAHIHFALKTANSSGANRYAKFELIFAKCDYNGVWSEDTAITQEQTIPNGAGALQNYLLSFSTAVTLTGLHVGSQIRCRVRRITATGGTEYADDVYITQVGMHVQLDTIGSRTSSGK